MLKATIIVIQAKEQCKFKVNFPNDFLRESEYKINLSLDSKYDLTDDGIGSSSEILDTIATDCEKTEGFQFYQLTLLFGV